MTSGERRDSFLRDLQEVLNRHKAEIIVTDDGKSYGMHSGLARVSLDADGNLPFTEFDLPGFMAAETADEVQK